jgi:periplasmic protein TonB
MIFRNAVILAFCLFKMVAFSQVDAPVLPPKIDTIYPIIRCDDTDIIFINPHTYPEFEGGEKALRVFINENLRWANREICLEGKVYVGFIITKEGDLTDIKVRKGIHPAFDEEAIRVVKLTSGKWKAGKQNGRAVNVAYTMPIKFKLE